MERSAIIVLTAQSWTATVKKSLKDYSVYLCYVIEKKTVSVITEALFNSTSDVTV